MPEKQTAAIVSVKNRTKDEAKGVRELASGSVRRGGILKERTLAGSRQDHITMPMKESTKNSIMKTYPKFVWFVFGKEQRMEAGPPLATSGFPAAINSSFMAWISGQYIPITKRPAMNAPNIWLTMKYGTFFHGNPCQSASAMVIAGLKCPPEVEAQVMMANEIPIAKAHPIWNRLEKAVTPMAFSAFSVNPALSMKVSQYLYWEPGEGGHV